MDLSSWLSNRKCSHRLIPSASSGCTSAGRVAPAYVLLFSVSLFVLFSVMLWMFAVLTWEKSSLPTEWFGLNHFLAKEQSMHSLLFSFLKTRHFSSLPFYLFPCSISESFLTVKGAALFLPRGNGSSTPRISHRRNKHAGKCGIDGWGLSAPSGFRVHLSGAHCHLWHTFIWSMCVLKPDLPVSMVMEKKVFKTFLFKQDHQWMTSGQQSWHGGFLRMIFAPQNIIL